MRNLAVIGLFVVFLAAWGNEPTSQFWQSGIETATVTNVIDGDTVDIRFDDGRTDRVRYIGMNSTESGERCFSEARTANADLVLGKQVVMMKDTSNVDSFGRLLRYVFVGGTFVNAELVADGWAEAVEYPPDIAFAGYFEYLEQQAREADLGCHQLGVFAEVANQPALTATPIVLISTSRQINLRSGPGTDYPVQRTLAAGSTNVKAVGRNAAGDWLVLEDGSWAATWVVTVTGDPSSLPVLEVAPAPAASSRMAPVPAAQQPAQQPALPSRSSCNCSKSCSQMASCEEAYFQLQQCGCTARDNDGDGVPCESICPGG